jgi:Tn3 transposase DDE domain
MIQVALSIQAGRVMPSMLLRKLGSYSPKSLLYRAFRELGRVERTLFLLRYISSTEVRRVNTVDFGTLVLQIEPVGWRGTLASCKVVVHQQPDTTLTLTVGARRVGNYTAKGVLLPPKTIRHQNLRKRRVVEKSKRRLSHHACKSRIMRGICTFPQLLVANFCNRTLHLLQRPDICTC